MTDRGKVLRDRKREGSLKGKKEKRERGDVPGVSGRTGPLSTTLEEERRKNKGLAWKQGKERERERMMTEGEEEEERLR